MIEFSEQEGMLIADTVLSYDDAKELLKMLLTRTKGGTTYAAALKAEVEAFYKDYLQSEWKTYTLDGKKAEKKHWYATNEIGTIYNLYSRWEKLANEWLGIMSTKAALVSMNEDEDTLKININQVYYGAEEIFLSNSTSTEKTSLSAKRNRNTALFGNTDTRWTSQDKEWQAKYENAVREVLSGHYQKMVQELTTQYPTKEELDVAMSAIPGDKQKQNRQRLHVAQTELKKGNRIFTFDQQAFGQSSQSVKYGRYTEMFAKHMLRSKHIKTLTAENGVAFEKSLNGSVREEEKPYFLALAVTSLDNDAYTTGGDIIIKMKNGTSFSIQLKTANNSLSGGNPVNASVIATTCEKWIQALSLDGVEAQAEALLKAQSTQVFMEKTKKGISKMTAQELNKMVETLATKGKTSISIKNK